MNEYSYKETYMFWDRIAGVYDLVERGYNGKANRRAVEIVSDLISSDDNVLECARGTGMFSERIAPQCRSLTATDFSDKMLKIAERKCGRAGYDNCTFEFADITDLKYEDGSFDKVVAANVIHLLDDPSAAMKEFVRIARPGGEIIIPTYINKSLRSSDRAAKLFDKMGAGFKRQFDHETYREFFSGLGYPDAEYHLAEGRMPCDVAVIRVGDIK